MQVKFVGSYNPYQFTSHTSFGSVMQGRAYSSAAYRFGFNGKEKEADGTADNYDFGARIYDGRLGRWLSVDPALKDYTAFSPFNFAAQNPIIIIDIDGERVYFVPGLGYSPNRPKEGPNANEDYVDGVSDAMTKAGIDNKVIDGSNPDLTKQGPISQRWGDMMFVLNFGSKPAMSINDDIRISKTVNAISADLVANPPDRANGEQVNLMGTSQGSVSIAQATIFLLENPEAYGLDKDFKVDNLILVGSPIDKKSELFKKLESLKKEGKIGEIRYDNGYQSTNKKGKVNDGATGAAGRNKVQGLLRGASFMIGAIIKGKNHPHVAASRNEATDGKSATFGEQLTNKLVEDGIK